jgi:hypothetical protein
MRQMLKASSLLILALSMMGAAALSAPSSAKEPYQYEKEITLEPFEAAKVAVCELDYQRGVRDRVDYGWRVSSSNTVSVSFWVEDSEGVSCKGGLARSFSGTFYAPYMRLETYTFWFRNPCNETITIDYYVKGKDCTYS